MMEFGLEKSTSTNPSKYITDERDDKAFWLWSLPVGGGLTMIPYLVNFCESGMPKTTTYMIL